MIHDIFANCHVTELPTSIHDISRHIFSFIKNLAYFGDSRVLKVDCFVEPLHIPSVKRVRQVNSVVGSTDWLLCHGRTRRLLFIPFIALLVEVLSPLFLVLHYLLRRITIEIAFSVDSVALLILLSFLDL